MTRTRTTLLSILLIAMAHALPAQQTCAGCEWSARGDRSEGVKTKSLMISGGSFELLSVAYLGDRGAGGGASLRLSFWMPEAGTLDEYRVWAPMPSATEREKVSYVMEPAKKDHPAGRAEFSWPQGDVVAPLELPLDSLNVLIRSGKVYLPGLLTSSAGAAPAGGYGFVFESSAGIDADCDVVRAGDGAAVRRMECYEELGGAIEVTWDGRDDDGGPVADGEYVLKIEGDMLAETIRPLEASVPFRHRASLQ